MNHKKLRSIIHPIEGWLSDHEAILLHEIARMNTAHGEIVEIGSWKGRSTVAIALGLLESKNGGSVFAVDPHEGTIDVKKKHHFNTTLAEFKKNIRNARVNDVVVPLVMTSVAASKKWKKPIRMLFLDGLHDYENTASDYQSWSPFVVPGGVIAFHDGFCGEEGVWNAITLHCFSRKDIVDMGSVGSIFYVHLGHPTLFSSLLVFLKKKIVMFSYFIHTHSVPKIVKMIFIHKVLRLFLITNYTVAVYTEGENL